MTGLTWAPLIGENALFHDVGRIFAPVFDLFATILAFIYGVIPNYAVAIALLTILIMAVLTPLTVKSTKSMIAMQRMQPEIKKLQQKYKGAENREQLNQELMRLYKEEGINPAGGCIPMLLQMPFLIVLYDVIKGITNTGTYDAHGVCQAAIVAGHQVCALPRYIPHSSQMYHNLVAHPGQMVAFGMNLALKPFSHHGSVWAAVPFFVLVAVAVGLQFIQMRAMSSRNPAAAQANPQMQTMQKIMPIFFAYIYFIIPAAVVIYMIVSTIIRIATQDLLFRTGYVQPVGAERTIPGKSKEIPKSGRDVPAKSKELPRPKKELAETADGAATEATGNGASTSKKPARPSPGKGPAAGKSGKPNPRPSGASGNGSSRVNGAGANGNTGGTTAPQGQNRSKAKRTRKAR